MTKPITSNGPQPVEYKVLFEASDESVINQCGTLHIKHLDYRSFITKFGLRFITEIYRDVFTARNGAIIYASEAGKVTGFSLGVYNSDLLFSGVKKSLSNTE